MTFTVRRRVVLSMIVALALGWVYVEWSLQLGLALVHDWRGSVYAPCTGTWRDIGYSCNQAGFNAGLGWVVLVGVSLALLSICWLVARWSLQPLQTMAVAVGRLGPQNLGERTRLSGPRDEARQLGEAVDAMLDRVAAGYEGQRRFAANASHELRTPLAVQRTLIEVSMAGAPTEEQRELLTRQLLATNERNENLIEALLVLAETDRGLMSRTPVRLDALTADAVSVLVDQARSLGVAMYCQLDPVTVDGEPALLDRLITNLVQNAIKHNHPGGRVDVTVRDSGELDVSNTGPDVAPERVPGLFEPFRRATGERMEHGGGAGLGLTIARSITQAHGARIAARPRLGGGLIVTVEFSGRSAEAARGA